MPKRMKVNPSGKVGENECLMAQPMCSFRRCHPKYMPLAERVDLV